MASERASPYQTTEVIDVKDSNPIDKVEPEKITHIDHGSDQQEVIDEGKTEDDKPVGPDIAVLEIDNGDKKTEVENLHSAENTIEPESDGQSGKLLEGAEVSSTNETVSEVVVTEQKDGENKIGQMHTEANEISESKTETVFNLEPDKTGEKIVEDIENAEATQSTSDIKLQEPDVSRNETSNTESKESITEIPETREVPTEVNNSQLEVSTDEKVVDPEMEAAAIDTSKADDSVENNPDVPTAVEVLVITGETGSEQSTPKEYDTVENKPEKPNVEHGLSETSEPPSETEGQAEQSATNSENKFQAEDKVDEVSTKLDGPLEAAALEIAKDGESSKDIPEQLDLAKKDEVAKELLDSVAETDMVADEPIKEQSIIEEEFQDSVAEPDTVSDEPIKDHSVIEEEFLDSVAEPDMVADERIKEQSVIEGQPDEKVISSHQEVKLTEVAAEVASRVETEGHGIENTSEKLDVEPIVKTTLLDLMNGESVSDVTKELVKELKPEQRHDSDAPIVADAEKELKKSEPDSNEAGELVKESAKIDLSTPVGTTDVDKKVEDEKTVEEPLKVEENTKSIKSIEKTVRDEKAGEGTVEGENKDEKVEFRDLNSTDALNNAAGEASKQEVTIKSVQRHLNSIMSMVKKSIVKVKKVITGKSPSSKSSSKDEVKVKQ